MELFSKLLYTISFLVKCEVNQKDLTHSRKTDETLPYNLIETSLGKQTLESTKMPQILLIAIVDLINCKSFAVTPIILLFLPFFTR